MNLPLVSVIVPAYNSSDTIDRCLASVEAQTYKNLEIIVIDDGSRDETVALASKHNVTLVEVKPNAGAPHAMNVGVEHAKGKYVFYLDADAWAPKWLIQRALDSFTEGNYAALGGWYIPIGGDKLYGLYTRTQMFDRISRAPKQVFEGKADPQLYGCFLGFTREVLAEEKFTEDFKAIYDREYLSRLTHKGYKVLFSKDLYVYHPVPAKISGAVRSLRVQSMWMGMVGKQNPKVVTYHIGMVAAIIGVVILSVLVWPLIIALALAAFTIAQAYQFNKVRRRFSIKTKTMISLVALTYVLTAAVLSGFIVGLFKKPKSHWK
jgi:glycosyltransferase involved in cell wall biosynthesis